MPSAVDPATSLTLLRLLCQPERDERAWQDFYLRYRPLIGRWCARAHLQPADIEDVTHQVLQRVFTRINTYDRDRGERFRGWLKTVVQNAVKDFLRTARRRPGDQAAGGSAALELLNAIAEAASVDSLVDELDTSLKRDLADVLARVERQVEPDTMRCFTMVVLEGRQIADVAAQLKKSYAAVCMAIQRVKNKLRAEGAALKPPSEPGED